MNSTPATVRALVGELHPRNQIRKWGKSLRLLLTPLLFYVFLFCWCAFLAHISASAFFGVLTIAIIAMAFGLAML